MRETALGQNMPYDYICAGCGHRLGTISVENGQAIGWFKNPANCPKCETDLIPEEEAEGDV